MRLWIWAGLLLLVVAAVMLLRFGGRLLVASDPLPPHAQAAVALAGSAAASEARRAEAMRLLLEGRVDHVLLDVGQVSLWGEWVPELARRHVANAYGEQLASRVVICEMKVDSTAEELLAVRRCLREQGWSAVILVTSNYHTRRVRLLARRTLAAENPPTVFVVHGIPDGDFEPEGWWRRRRLAKTWLEETTKLLWSFLFSPRDAPG
ncbi:MAG: YdcF family protein [Candidatus Acidiferrales bacterium]